MFRSKINLKVHFVETGYIAFLLLVFFVIFMSINTSQPHARNVIPLVDSGVPSVSKLPERDVLNLNLDKNNVLTVDGEEVAIDQLKSIVKEFVDNPDNEDEKPEKAWRNIPYFGPMLITVQHVIAFNFDKRSHFGSYIAVRKEVKRAYFELRDELAEKKWQKKFKTLLPGEKRAVRMIYPQQVSEKIY